MNWIRLPIGICILAAWVGITFSNIVILPKKLAPTVTVHTVQKIPMPLVIRAPGTLEPKESILIKSEFEGPLVSRKYRVGQQVTKGQFLLEIGRDMIQVDYNSKRDAFVNNQADLFRAEKDYRLQKMLLRKGAVSQSSVDDSQQKLIKARQSLRSASESFELVKRKWAQNKIFAPFTGTIVKDAIEGERFIASGKELITLADLSECFVKARVDELELSQIKEGLLASVRVQAFEKVLLNARVIQIGAQAEGTGLPEVPVLLKLEDVQGLVLRPKLTAEVRIDIGKTQPTLVIPKSALANDDGSNSVWMMGLAARIHKQKVTIGKLNPDSIQILSGLKEGDKIIQTADAAFVEGMRVNIHE